jgi:hypothetical protein
MGFRVIKPVFSPRPPSLTEKSMVSPDTFYPTLLIPAFQILGSTVKGREGAEDQKCTRKGGDERDEKMFSPLPLSLSLLSKTN